LKPKNQLGKKAREQGGKKLKKVVAHGFVVLELLKESKNAEKSATI